MKERRASNGQCRPTLRDQFPADADTERTPRGDGAQTSKQRRHLHEPEKVPEEGGPIAGTDLTRSHGQSNGLRVHRIYFAAVSFVGLLLVMASIVIAATRR